MSTTYGFATVDPKNGSMITDQRVSRREMLREALGMATGMAAAGPMCTARAGCAMAGLLGAEGGVHPGTSRSTRGGSHQMRRPVGSRIGADVVRVDPTVRLQIVEGWGTSLAWWANVIGGWSEATRNAIADLVFNPLGGLGLNVVRYNSGGGDDPRHDHMRPGAAVPGYQPAPGVWDWNADANQRWMLLAAQERGARAFEAFSNSPPYWMTRSGCTSGADDGTNNLHDAYVDRFAHYLAEVVAHFRNNWGLRFQTIEPFNEPSIRNWRRFHNQEGCHTSRAQQRAVIARLRTQLTARGVTDTTIAAADEYSTEDMLKTLDAYEWTALSHLSRINTHSYCATRRIDLRARAAAAGKGLWMTEYGTGGGPHDRHAIWPALRLAAHIRRDMNELQPTAWVYWQAVEHEEGNNWGFIHADFTGASEQYWLTKQYYGMAHYSRFIRPRYQILGVSHNSAVAAYEHASGTLVIVHDNGATHELPVCFDLSGFSSLAPSAIAYRTSPTENLARTADLQLAGKTLTLTVPAQSITSYVLTEVAL
jgi:O-glycosyl hydrolase